MGDAMDNSAIGTETSMMTVQVCYLSPDEQLIQEVPVPVGTTVVQALEKAGLSERFADAIRQGYIGIYGRKVPVDTVLSPEDRIEIYRPLQDLPQNIRRRRVEQMRGKTYTKWNKDAPRR